MFVLQTPKTMENEVQKEILLATPNYYLIPEKYGNRNN